MLFAFNAGQSLSQADTIELSDILQLAAGAEQTNQMEDALDYIDQGILKSKEKKEYSWEGRFRIKKAELLIANNDYETAISELDQSIILFRRNEQLNQTSYATNLKGKTLADMGRFQEALDIYLKTLKSNEQRKDEKGMADTYTNIADVLFYLRRCDEGAQYGEKAINLYKKLNDQYGLADAYNQTAMNLLNDDSMPKALEYVNNALEITYSLDVPPISLAVLLNAKGNVLKNMGRYKDAILPYQESLEIVSELEHTAGISATLANIGDVYRFMGEYENALPYIVRSVEICKESGFNANMIENLDHLSNVYKNLGQYETALKYREEHQILQDSVLSAENAAFGDELLAKYESDKKEEQLIRNQKERNLLYAILSLAALALGILIIFFYQKRKSNILLEEKNEQKEYLIKEIHHRVKNNLQIISSLLNLQSNVIEDDKAVSAVIEGRNRVQSMSLIHQKLYLGDNLAEVNMQDYLDDFSAHLLDSFGQYDNNITIINKADIPSLDVDTAIPLGLIINELLTNSLKYAFPNGKKGTIKSNLYINDDNVLILAVEDNGVGSQSKDIQSPKNTKFGSNMVQIFSKKLKGIVEEYRTDDGFKTIIRFERYRLGGAWAS